MRSRPHVHTSADGGLPVDAHVDLTGVVEQLVAEPPGARIADLRRTDAGLQRAGRVDDGVLDRKQVLLRDSVTVGDRLLQVRRQRSAVRSEVMISPRVTGSFCLVLACHALCSRTVFP